LEVAEEARVAEGGGKAPRGGQEALAFARVAAAAPRPVEEESPDDVIVKKRRRSLAPSVPAAHRLADDAEGPDEDGETAVGVGRHKGEEKSRKS